MESQLQKDWRIYYWWYHWSWKWDCSNLCWDVHLCKGNGKWFGWVFFMIFWAFTNLSRLTFESDHCYVGCILSSNGLLIGSFVTDGLFNIKTYKIDFNTLPFHHHFISNYFFYLLKNIVFKNIPDSIIIRQLELISFLSFRLPSWLVS